MSQETQPSISSFVIRFVRDPLEEKEKVGSYRGAIRHIQTDEEVGFTRWQDAVNFIEQYIPIHDLNQKE
ncbi:MAG: hypothetical protein ISR58_16325 [Anaerolineales bacterium]|nr:hypothetical protein [Chloroflexota bacterium]MBL6982741.1 hypothetical protein [Anaerolineales bacterium]